MLRRTRLAAAVACCGLLYLAAACGSSTSGGSPTASAKSDTASNTSSVPNPLTVTKLMSHPCDALTADQLQPYLGTVGSREPDASDPGSWSACNYHPADTNQAQVSVLIEPSFGGLANLDQAGNGWAVRIDDIDGYPAEHVSQVGETGPQNGDCGTTVVVSNSAAINVYVRSSAAGSKYYANACTPADALVPDVIANLKSKS
ncbi:MAG TPA: DUF3558 domain-containing protein [Pseudonocardiaceae bacterium]